MSGKMSDPFLDALSAAIGADRLSSEPEAMAPWLTDWRGRWTGTARALAEPRSTGEVAALVALAAEHRVPIVPQGGNTSMVGGATPDSSGTALLLSLRRMNRIRAISPTMAVAEAGVILEHLHEAAAVQGARFPLTLGARGSATLGGLAAANAGGTQVLRFGTMRRLVLGVEAVLPDGSVHDGLAALKKDNRGYNLDQLLVGSEGTLGIITALALQLVPAVAARAVAWVGLAGPHQALALLRRLEAGTERVEGYELVPDDCLQRVIAHIPGSRAPLAGRHRWHVLIEATAASMEGEQPAALIERLLAPAIADGLVEDAAIAANEAQADAFWRLRDTISEAERADGPALQHDVSVPVAAMPDFLVEGAAAVERTFPGTDASGFGHLGDGNVHFHVRAPTKDPDGWIAREGAAASRLVHDLVSAAGGSISAEHGIGQMKRDELVRLLPPARMAAMRAIKAALDPRNILNPGKLL